MIEQGREIVLESLLGLFNAFEGHIQLLIEGLLDSIIRTKVINGLPPSILLVSCERKRIDLLRLCLFLDIEVPISFGFLIVVVLVLLQLVKLMYLLQSVVVFAIDRHVVGYCFMLSNSFELHA